MGAFYRPNGAILGVAGNIDWDRLVERVESLFGDWESVDVGRAAERLAADRARRTSHFESNQCHIGIAFPTVPYRDPQYLQAWAAVGVLSDGMSSRLFTEVREKRGLCYTVNASLQTQLTRARVLCYAGTTAERPQETLDVTYAELVRLGAGIEQAELDRLKARIKSGLIMQQESTSSRSGVDRPRLVSPGARAHRWRSWAAKSMRSRPTRSTPISPNTRRAISCLLRWARKN